MIVDAHLHLFRIVGSGDRGGFLGGERTAFHDDVLGVGDDLVLRQRGLVLGHL